MDSEGFGEEEPHLLEEPIAWCGCKIRSTVEGGWVCLPPVFRSKVDDPDGIGLGGGTYVHLLCCWVGVPKGKWLVGLLVKEEEVEHGASATVGVYGCRCEGDVGVEEMLDDVFPR